MRAATVIVRAVVAGAFCVFTVAAVLLAPSAAAAPALLDELKQLLERGEFEQAYALGKAREVEAEGDPAFDFFLGLAALETGRFNEASFALERAAIVEPEEARIRFELARSFYLGGNFDAARLELAQLRDASVPAELRAAAEAYAARIDEAEQAMGRRMLLFVETSGGHDTNINSATTLGGFSTPTGSGVLNDSSRATDDAYGNLAAGFVYAMPFSKSTGVDVSGGITYKDNVDTSAFDLGTVRLESGYSIGLGDATLRLGARMQAVVLDKERFQHAGGLVAALTYPLDGGWTGNLIAGATAIRYQGDHLRDTNQYLVAASVGRQFGPVLHSFSVFAADEPARDDSFGKYNGRDFLGVGYGTQWQIRPDVAALLAVGWQATRYDALNPVFSCTTCVPPVRVVRDDDQFTGRLGMTWALSSALSVRGEYRYSDVDSNIDLYRYDRHEIEATLRVAF